MFCDREDLTSWHLSQSPRDLPKSLSPTRGRVGHHTDVVTHVSEVFRQSDSYGKTNTNTRKQMHEELVVTPTLVITRHAINRNDSCQTNQLVLTNQDNIYISLLGVLDDFQLSTKIQLTHERRAARNHGIC